ncbi:hypothetical protein GCM10010232_67600 [Streptomyces amakusaensis]
MVRGWGELGVGLAVVRGQAGVDRGDAGVVQGAHPADTGLAYALRLWWLLAGWRAELGEGRGGLGSVLAAGCGQGFEVPGHLADHGRSLAAALYLAPHQQQAAMEDGVRDLVAGSAEEGCPTPLGVDPHGGVRGDATPCPGVRHVWGEVSPVAVNDLSNETGRRDSPDRVGGRGSLRSTSQ